MAKFTGTVQHNDLEGGFYELHADDGAVYRLTGTFTVAAGDRVRVHGKVESGGFGLHMTGPALAVEKIEKA
jgi:hypothetical protein